MILPILICQSNSKLKKTEIFIKHKIQSASAFYHSVSYPNFIAYVAKDALIGPKNRAIFLIELNCQSDKQKAVYAFNQIFGACSEDDPDCDADNESSNSMPSYMSLEDLFQPYEMEMTVDQTYFWKKLSWHHFIIYCKIYKVSLNCHW